MSASEQLVVAEFPGMKWENTTSLTLLTGTFMMQRTIDEKVVLTEAFLWPHTFLEFTPAVILYVP